MLFLSYHVNFPKQKIAMIKGRQRVLISFKAFPVIGHLYLFSLADAKRTR